MKYLFFLFTGFAFGQQTQFVDFKSVQGQIKLNPIEKSVSGNVKYEFEVLKPIDTIKIDAHKMSFSEVKLNNSTIRFETNEKQLLLIYPFKKGKNSLNFQYNAVPKQTLYFLGSDKNQNLQIWTQGQGKYTSHWFPCIDDVNEKIIFNLSITFNKNFQVISNGKLSSSTIKKDFIDWKYKMKKPMSSYLLMLAVGQFAMKSKLSKSGIPLEMYYEHNDSTKFEPTYRYSKEIFDFLEQEIGVKYPWKIYKQAPIRDFLYAGMENTSATLFANQFVVDSVGFEDHNYVNVNAHELAHHWFGNLITVESGKHHWLQEGFATYYSLLAERKVFGDDYFYNKLNDYSQLIQNASKTDTIPMLNPKASSLTYYQKGALALHVIREEIGEEVFKKIVKNYLKKYSFKNVNTDDFLSEIKKKTDYDIEKFRKVWLEESNYNKLIINNLINKNNSIRLLFEIEKLKDSPLKSKMEFFQEIMKSNVFWTVKNAIIYQLENENFEESKLLLQLGLNTNSQKVRQAIAAILNKIPEEFRTNYESLMYDKSYKTKDIALVNLWKNFPHNRLQYIEKSKNWIGFNDYSLRITWLSLAIATPEFRHEKNALFKELLDYSSNSYEARTRQIALINLKNLGLIDEFYLKNLINLTTHHAWNFSKFGKNLILELLKNPERRLDFENILSDLNGEEQFQLQRLLKK